MKKVLLVASLVSVLLLAGCNKEEKVNNNVPEVTDNEQQESNVIIEENKSVPTYSYNFSKREEIQAIRNGYVEIVVDKEGSAFLHLIGNIDDESNTTLKTNLKSIEQNFETYSPEGYIEDVYDDDMITTTELKGIKLDITDALTAYYIHMGNGGMSYFVFIRENGKLSYLCYDNIVDGANVEVKDISNIEKVVSVVENEYTLTPYAVDIDGNEISLYDYIK